MSIDLSLLMPEFSERLKDFVLEAQYEGHDVDVQCGFRSIEAQNALYALGRTIKNPDGVNSQRPMGNIVTNAKGGHSFHQWGIAADVVYRNDGHFTWDVPDSSYLTLASIAKNHGLEWGGNWVGSGKALGDLDHFQYTKGLTIEEAINLGTPQKVWDEIRRRQ